MSSPTTFGVRLRSLRDAAGLTAQSLAKAIGVERAYISGIERGHERPPGKDLCGRLASVLRADADELWQLAAWGRVGDEEALVFRRIIESSRPPGISTDQRELSVAIGHIAAMRPELPLASALHGTLTKLAGASFSRSLWADEQGPSPDNGRAPDPDPLSALCLVLEGLASLPEPAAAELAIALGAMTRAVSHTAASRGAPDAKFPSPQKSRRK